MERFSRPVCTAFRPLMFEGQLCYQLDLEDIQKNISFSKGETNGLTFLMDYNEDKTINEQSLEQRDGTSPNDDATIYVDTLGRIHMIRKTAL